MARVWGGKSKVVELLGLNDLMQSRICLLAHVDDINPVAVQTGEDQLVPFCTRVAATGTSVPAGVVQLILLPMEGKLHPADDLCMED